jgi:two-component system cell cycle sensor histidine kinase/response regulator CckA
VTGSRFPRLLTFVALLVLLSHVATVVYLGTSSVGSLIGNALQIFCSFLATFLSFRAAGKAPGFSRSFWILVGCGMGIWGIADLGWTYYEVIQHTEPPSSSLIRFLFDTHGMFFVMAIFLDQEKTDSQVDLAEALDFAQIGILFFFIYFGMYYLPALDLNKTEALRREFAVMSLADSGILALSILQWWRGRHAQIRKLYGGLAIYALIYTLFSTVALAQQVQNETPTGTWIDLAWSLPLLYAAFWSAQWLPCEDKPGQRRVRPKSVLELILTNGMFAFSPLIILFQVAQIGPGWKAIRFTLLGVSFVCYALRIGLSQHRQLEDGETVRRQSLAMDTSSNGMAIVNEKGVHVYANQSLAQMLGFESPDRISGKPWQVVYAFQDIARLEQEARDALKGSGKWSARLSLKRPDASVIPVELTVAAMPDGGTAWVCRDLSRSERAEKARSEAETKYRMLVEQVNAITYIAEIGINGKWYYVSPQIEAILGYTADEWLAIAHDWADKINPLDLPAVVAAEEASEKGVPFQAEFRVKRKDGREVWLNDNAVIVHGSDSHPLMEGIMVDITERKQLETQLQQSRKMEAVGRLAGGIAHDFNNLLTIITGYTELALSRRNVPSELHSDIERIENAAERAAALVRQLLAFSRRQVMQPKTLDLNKITLNLDALLRRLMDERIEMLTRIQEKLGKVKADPAQIEQVVMNLVVNARDAMPDGGRLIIETSNVDLDSNYADEHVTVKPGPYVMLAVSDTGVGMDRETVAHIFEPFYTTKESGQGTGLGLSTVYGIVKQSGGYIWVYSEPGKGSTFKVYLPRVDEFEEQPSVPQAQKFQRGNETVLLVEDEDAVRDLIKTVLTEHGFVVLPARDPQHAEEVAAGFTGEIHLLLTDMVMPGRSGRELAVRITARRPNIHVLYMSGYTDNVITSGGMLEKGLAFLQKPFSPATLVQKVQEVLRHTTAS